MALRTSADQGVEPVVRAQSPVARTAWVLPPFVLAMYALKALGPVKDPDAYWHIVAGEHLAATGDFVLTDPFGASTEKVWILNQWLPEVLMHLVNAAYGLPGVAWLLSLAALLVGLAVYAACRRRSSSLVSALVVAVVFVALSGSISPRPQMVAFALTAVTTSAWLLTREDGRPRWWLLPLSWLWACSHGMWFVGPAVGLVVVLGMVLERRTTLRGATRLAVVPIGSLFLAALTPVGPRLLTSPFQVGGVTGYISEWQRPSIFDAAVLASLLLIVITVSTSVRRRPLPWTAILLTLVALGFTLLWSRTVGLAAVLVAPLAAAGLERVVGGERSESSSVPGRERVAVAAASLVGLLGAGLLAPGVAAAPGIGANGLDDALSRLPAGSVVCNDQVDGGWLMLRHPNLRPTMDTRVELYSAHHIQTYLDFMAARPGWEAFPRENGCAFALLPVHDDGAITAKLTDAAAGWRLLDQAGGHVLLGAPAT